MPTRDLSRREFLTASVTGAAALTLAGCGSGAGAVAVPGSDVPNAGGDTVRAPAYSLSNDIVVADGNGQTYALDVQGGSLTQLDAGGGVNWAQPAGTLNGPSSVAVDADGRIVVSNHGEHAIHVLDEDGRLIDTRGAHGGEAGEFRGASDFALGEDGRLYVADVFNHRIQVMAPDGSIERVFGALGAGEGELNSPRALAFDSYGDLHVLSVANARVDVFDTTGAHLRSYGGDGVGEFLVPADLSIGRDDRCYVVDVGKGCVEVFENAGYAAVGCFTPRNEAGDPIAPRRMNPDAADGFTITTA